MKLLSINTGVARELEYHGRTVTTGIFKSPVAGPVMIRGEQVDGDVQADRRVHGGADKAVYAYPFEHYAYWADRLDRKSFDYGHFGENLTLSGGTESALYIGDTLRIGDTRLQVAQPRSPCFKLDLRMGIDGFMNEFIASGRVGFYLRVLRPGSITTGSEIELEPGAQRTLTVAEVFALRFAAEIDLDRLRQACELATLADSWREALRARMAKQS
jgi:MOSC domain-containing protein YiiM